MINYDSFLDGFLAGQARPGKIWQTYLAGVRLMMVHRERAFFADRADAGNQLAAKLEPYAGRAVAYAVPRGGVPVALQVARHLRIPLDIVVTRKIPIPSNPEAGYGAVAEDGSIFLNRPLMAQFQINAEEAARDAEKVRREIKRRSAAFRAHLPPASMDGESAILIDDGLASGYTMLAAIKSARGHGASEVVVAVPVASVGAFELVRPKTDALVALIVAETRVFAVASFYRQWHDLNDEEVIRYLDSWRQIKPAVQGDSTRNAK